MKIHLYYARFISCEAPEMIEREEEIRFESFSDKNAINIALKMCDLLKLTSICDWNFEVINLTCRQRLVMF